MAMNGHGPNGGAHLNRGLLNADEPDVMEDHASTSPDQALLNGHDDAESIDLNSGSSDDDDDEFVVPISDKFKAMINGGDSVASAASSTQRKNPYDNLRDIARHEETYETETENLALYQPELQRRPRVAQILSNLVRFNSNNDTPLNAESSMLALLRKQPIKMNTLVGVYLPTIQNILGVILFLRLTWIVGIAGVGQSLLIVLICTTTTMLTAISMSAIATNGVVPAGGAYFMISRALGPEFGGAVGILFYLGTAFASAMYTLGAIELLLTYIAPGMSAFGEIEPGTPSLLNNMRLYGTVLLCLMGFIVFVGVKYVNRFASFCLATVLLSILCIYIGYFASPTSRQPDVCIIDEALVRSSYDGNCTAADATLYPTWQNANSSYSGYVQAFPGLGSGVFQSNVGPHYLKGGESAPGQKGHDDVVVADITTSFTLLLAIFFPACTGIMAGSNRSGDLKDASRAIPTGTIAAIATTALIYFTSVLFLGGVVQGPLLRDKFGDSINGGLVIAELAWPHPIVILIGALLSTIGAGLQSLTGAPRLLQAIAQDNLLPFLSYFGKASASGEPTRALVLTLIISECGVLIASLDAVAPIITMFFLMCYGFVNLACSLQSLLRAPSWRPRFKYYHWSLSSLGLVLCVLLMFVSSWFYALAAIVLAAVVYYYIEFKGAAKEWGDGIRGLSMQAARFSLLRLEEAQPHTKNWRPQILTFVKLNDATLDVSEPRLLDLAGSLKNGKGLNMVASVLEGDLIERCSDRATGQVAIKAAMKKADIQGFAEVVVCPSLAQGMSFLVQSAGLGALKHNTVMLGWPEGWRERLEHAQAEAAGQSAEEAAASLRQVSVFMRVLLDAASNEHAIIVPKNLHMFPDPGVPETGTIDVWWIVHDGGMLLLLAFLLQQDVVWRKCRLRVFTVAENDDNSVQMQQDLQSFLYHLRIDADVKVVEMLDSDISAYTYERTAQMESRTQLMEDLNLSPKQRARVAEAVADRSRADAAHGAVRADRPLTDNVRRMNTSVKLNRIIQQHSHDARLILLNLPGAPKECADSYDAAMSYMEYVDVLTENLQRIIMIRGGGREVITIFS
ncbi:solute carrier family 12 member 6 [Salpingoeca rosetta]|uniref:Solute carrier family 12 member 6 n=1 Tax=Salpingoeca rosetta (strain ATCC 50818 / BSB-021) TaxID=946362 RepID=F2TZZ4_SALR5|nr:solute carrier family 12 member 6 [Salpingoeca rosetta]EGD80722.1 solute carrier family 12 member 6 [Salpingoeca rosetta]|eukprot:XP_004997283.1 solute carrier family 12 member 6 [Salpingoeca rosetta]